MAVIQWSIAGFFRDFSILRMRKRPGSARLSYFTPRFWGQQTYRHDAQGPAILAGFSREWENYVYGVCNVDLS